MKSTGVVRRIDDLGRIVIPKEIRKTFRIKEGENLEIFITDNETISLKKYSTLNKFEELIKSLLKTFSQINKKVIVTDLNNILGKNISIDQSFYKLLEERKRIIKNNDYIKIYDNEIKSSYIIEPIILNGDLIGSIVLLSDENINTNDILLIDFASKILINYIEE